MHYGIGNANVCETVTVRELVGRSIVWVEIAKARSRFKFKWATR